MTTPYIGDANLKALKALMKKHHLNTVDVARMLGYSSQYIRALHCGQFKVPTRALQHLKLLLA